MTSLSEAPSRILIVDNIPGTLKHLSALIGFHPELKVAGPAKTGRQAIDAAARILPDLLLMDILMPELDGISAAEQIRARMPEVRIVMMSVQGDADYLRRPPHSRCVGTSMP